MKIFIIPYNHYSKREGFTGSHYQSTAKILSHLQGKIVEKSIKYDSLKNKHHK
jgi:hypothetical protein